MVEGQPSGVFLGCVSDAASFALTGSVSPGQIVTLFGSGLGPPQGVSFQLAGGRVPVNVGGTRVLVDGVPVPILFASGRQVNAILPYSLRSPRPSIQVEYGGSPGNVYASSQLEPAAITLFRQGDAVIVVNENGTLNSPRNPAPKGGSRVVLYGTGGGLTNPPSTAGEVTPPEQRWLTSRPRVRVPGLNMELEVEYAGGAPGLVAGVTQINVKLPVAFPTVSGYSQNQLPAVLETPGSASGATGFTIAVTPD
jgi:uncharacterized protein (TIGR03437 family)